MKNNNLYGEKQNMRYNIVQKPFKSTFFNESAFDNFYDNFLSYTQNNRSAYFTVPRANTIKNEHGYSIELAAPGFTRDEFELNVENNTLTVLVNTEDTQEYERSVTSREYQFKNFTRSWSLPESSNVEAITARYDAGILYIDIPVEDMRQKNKVITVQ